MLWNLEVSISLQHDMRPQSAVYLANDSRMYVWHPDPHGVLQPSHVRPRVSSQKTLPPEAMKLLRHLSSCPVTIDDPIQPFSCLILDNPPYMRSSLIQIAVSFVSGSSTLYLAPDVTRPVRFTETGAGY